MSLLYSLFTVLSLLCGVMDRGFAEVFEQYQDALARCSAVDFDDLLVHTLTLLTLHSHVNAHIAHVLLDEFQVITQELNASQL